MATRAEKWKADVYGQQCNEVCVCALLWFNDIEGLLAFVPDSFGEERNVTDSSGPKWHMV